MGQEEGRMTTCDRCGETIFSPKTGVVETDGGYGRYDKYQSLPEGWERQPAVGFLCPSCNNIYRLTIKQFLRGDADCP